MRFLAGERGLSPFVSVQTDSVALPRSYPQVTEVMCPRGKVKLTADFRLVPRIRTRGGFATLPRVTCLT